VPSAPLDVAFQLEDYLLEVDAEKGITTCVNLRTRMIMLNSNFTMGRRKGLEGATGRMKTGLAVKL
jgi:hypothetical protein